MNRLLRHLACAKSWRRRRRERRCCGRRMKSLQIPTVILNVPAPSRTIGQNGNDPMSSRGCATRALARTTRLTCGTKVTTARLVRTQQASDRWRWSDGALCFIFVRRRGVQLVITIVNGKLDDYIKEMDTNERH